jgi:hypothetical protein
LIVWRGGRRATGRPERGTSPDGKSDGFFDAAIAATVIARQDSLLVVDSILTAYPTASNY